MIDKLTMYKTVDISEKDINKNSFKPMKKIHDDGTIDNYYFNNKNNVEITYNPSTKILNVEGRLVNTSHIKSKVWNVDDLWVGYFKRDLLPLYQDNKGAFIDLETILDNFNERLFKLTKNKLDVREFTVTRIEICFNLYTLQRHRYIEIFNKIFKRDNDRHYVNFVEKFNKQPFTSFWIKSKGEFKDNTKDYYVVNFYFKHNQLLDLWNRRQYGTTAEDWETFSKDLKLCENILRLEVQLGSQLLFEMFGSNRPLKNFINIDWCRDIIVKRYEQFIGDKDCNFYSYDEAKSIIQTTDKIKQKDKLKLLQYIKKLARDNALGKKPTKVNKHLAKLGIHTFFIPKEWKIDGQLWNGDYLPSPMRLLDDKVKSLKQGKLEQMVYQGKYDLSYVLEYASKNNITDFDIYRLKKLDKETKYDDSMRKLVQILNLGR